MNRIERLNLIDSIGRHLQISMTTTDINTYLGGFGIPNNGTTMASSKWVYVKEMMSNVDDAIVFQIANELGINVPKSENLSSIKLAELLDGSAYAHAKQDFDNAIQDIDLRPENAIGMASTTLESICKAILDSFGEPYPSDESLQPLQKVVFEKLKLSPDGKADPDIKRILGGLINVGAGIATLRTRYSSFHGKGAKQYRLGKRHARLAVNSLSTIGLFLLETYQEQVNNQGESSK
ncbi:MAG: abortive infection family protein [Bacteroidia bacterium]|nr:abortive infection family protein [Bacteroidia bacterium]